ncbi:MAG: ATP-binding cassette domain-containing protein [Phycisphaerales bacterium]|nr:ATP-binding cassette domain-containing protein [Phycisphaerales bacterium]
MSAPAESIVALALDLGGESCYLDRRSQLQLTQCDELFVVVRGSVVLFARHRAGGRRHRIGVIQAGAAFAGPAAGIEAVAVSEAEFVRIRREPLARVVAQSPTEYALSAGIAATLAACGASVPPHADIATACAHCATTLARRGNATIETSFARHLRRLVSVATSRLAFPEELQSMLVDRPPGGRAHLPDTRLPPIVRACMQIAYDIGTDPSAIPTRIPRDNTRRPEQIYAHVAGLGIRPVFLDPGWWHSGVGSLLAFRAQDHAPVAIIPTPAGMVAYVHSGGATIGPVPVDAAFAAQLTATASQFHPTIAAHHASISQFLRFVVRGSERDFLYAFLVSGIASFVNLAIPLATGLLVTRVLPSNNGWSLFYLGCVLLGTTLSAAACGFVVSNLLLRAESRIASRALGGVLDRCLRMPTQTFRSFTSGDLADRIFSVGDIQTVISGAAISAIMAGVFSLMYVAVMLYVSTNAALIGCALLVVAVLWSVILSALRSRLSTTVLEGQGRLSTMALQFIGGIDTIRSAASEHYATLRWMGPFRETRLAAMRIRTLERLFDAFATGFPMVCLMIFWIVFLPVGVMGGVGLYGTAATDRIAQYLMFNAAFVAALYSVLEFGEHLGDLSAFRSTLRRIEPILSAPTERTSDREQPGVLDGKIDIDDVHFSYPGSANEVLRGVSMHIAAGESVAIVGGSGSGKSTLIQLILGMRRPTSGEVLFDGKALGRLDLVSVRRQIGAVVQNTRVVPGSILDNIVGSTMFTPVDAEAAIEAAGFGKEVGKMPMGVHTYVTDQTLSGGQVQKLMIARALVTRPRILIFDEATSALDEISQSQVVRSLEALQTTRVVVAHRLSTIRRADRIYVVELGRVVQSGNFAELMAVKGPFQEMAHRQLIDFPDETVI